MVEADITALETSFISAITDVKAPVLKILGAGVVITVIFVTYKLLRKAFGKSTN